jgi:hypothetical protein
VLGVLGDSAQVQALALQVSLWAKDPSQG